MQVVDWNIIIKEHGPIVWQTAYRLLGNDADAADCFQETFVCALEFSRRQRVKSFPALLVRLATTRAIDQLRRRFRHERNGNKGHNQLESTNNNPDPVQYVQQQELAAKLRIALAQLPLQEAQIFCLRYVNDMTYKRIANEFGITTTAAGVMLHRAKTKLRRFFGASMKERKSEVML